MRLHGIQAAAIWLFFIVCFVSGADVSCTSPGTVVEGESVLLTCHYNQNLQSEKQDFYIYRSALGKETVIVAICAWEDSSLTCDYQPGYSAEVQGHTVALNISHVHPEHAGKYVCTTLPPDDDMDIKGCNLTVQGKVKLPSPKVSCFAPAHLTHGKAVSVTCIFPDSLDAYGISLERLDSSSFAKPVELVRCNKEDPCEVNEDECKVKAEHNPTDGFRLISAKVQKAGQYLCKATKHGRQDEICLAKVETGQSDTSDGSLYQLTVPLYAILAFFIIAVIACVFVGAAVFVKRSDWCKNSLRRFRSEEQGPSSEPLRAVNVS